jgi:pilus assembly protein Flp/PilA
MRLLLRLDIPLPTQVVGGTCEGKTTMKLVWINFVRDESGQDLIEYALVAALIGLGAVVSIKSLSTKLNSVFTAIGTNLTSSI